MYNLKDNPLLVMGLGTRCRAAYELWHRSGANMAVDGADAEDLRDEKGKLLPLGVEVKLGTTTPSQHVKQTSLIGETRENICTSWSLFATCKMMSSLLQLIKSAAEDAVPGGVVLLSPVCSGFDQFRNYQHRGDVFRQTVTQGGMQTIFPCASRPVESAPDALGMLKPLVFHGARQTKRTMSKNNFLFCFGVFEEKPRCKSTMINQPPQRKDANQRQK